MRSGRAAQAVLLVRSARVARLDLQVPQVLPVQVAADRRDLKAQQVRRGPA